jgi:hypothetical protein
MTHLSALVQELGRDALSDGQPPLQRLAPRGIPVRLPGSPSLALSPKVGHYWPRPVKCPLVTIFDFGSLIRLGG